LREVDVDGYTWAVDKARADDLNIVISMEKVEQAFWPRIKED
jgi:hypothetical protein